MTRVLGGAATLLSTPIFNSILPTGAFKNANFGFAVIIGNQINSKFRARTLSLKFILLNIVQSIFEMTRYGS